MPINVDQLNFPQATAQAARVLECLSSEDPDLDELNDIILHDPVLAGTLIRYANSPLYRRGDEVSNVPTATRLIGLKNVRSAVVMSTLHSSLPMDDALSTVILDHLLGIAALCKLLARKCCPASADDLELIGLIHDVGMIVLAANFADEYRELMSRARSEGIALDVLEQEHFGLSHDQIAVKALHEFRLPAQHETVLTHFHQAGAGEGLEDSMARERAVLQLAHWLHWEQRGDEALPETLTHSREDLMAQLALDETDLKDVLEQLAESHAAAN